MMTLYVTESRLFIKSKGGDIIVGRNYEILFEVLFESIDDVTGCYWNVEGTNLF